MDNWRDLTCCAAFERWSWWRLISSNHWQIKMGRWSWKRSESRTCSGLSTVTSRLPLTWRPSWPSNWFPEVNIHALAVFTHWHAFHWRNSDKSLQCGITSTTSMLHWKDSDNSERIRGQIQAWKVERWSFRVPSTTFPSFWSSSSPSFSDFGQALPLVLLLLVVVLGYCSSLLVLY